MTKTDDAIEKFWKTWEKGAEVNRYDVQNREFINEAITYGIRQGRKDLAEEIKHLRHNVSVYMKQINRLKRKCTFYNNANRLRLEQIRASERLFYKLKSEGRITIEELRTAGISKSEVKRKLQEAMK